MMNNFIQSHLNKLYEKSFSNPELELRVLLNNCSLNNKEVFLNNFNIDNIDMNKFNLAFNRRLCNEPTSKIFNQKEFWSLDFYVDYHVLDPRPESEFLIEEIVNIYNNFDLNLNICDLGTGSGCLAITLAKIYKNSKIIATDISKNAIDIARKNAIKHNVLKKIKFDNCYWTTKKNKFDIIVSNPPYLSNKEYRTCKKNIKNYEPKLALIGGKDGLRSYREIAKIAPLIMKKKSLFFIEIGQFQECEIIKIFKSQGLNIVKIIKDYQAINRVLVFKKFKNI